MSVASPYFVPEIQNAGVTLHVNCASPTRLDSAPLFASQYHNIFGAINCRCPWSTAAAMTPVVEQDYGRIYKNSADRGDTALIVLWPTTNTSGVV